MNNQTGTIDFSVFEQVDIRVGRICFGRSSRRLPRARLQISRLNSGPNIGTQAQHRASDQLLAAISPGPSGTCCRQSRTATSRKTRLGSFGFRSSRLRIRAQHSFHARNGSHDWRQALLKVMSHVELRTGTPYANLMARPAAVRRRLSDYFDVCQDDCIPTAGRHRRPLRRSEIMLFRTTLKAYPTVLTVCPDYWRARESFEGLGFKVIDVHTEPFGFAITEAMLVAKAKETNPDLALPESA